MTPKELIAPLKEALEGICDKVVTEEKLMNFYPVGLPSPSTSRRNYERCLKWIKEGIEKEVRKGRVVTKVSIEAVSDKGVDVSVEFSK